MPRHPIDGTVLVWSCSSSRGLHSQVRTITRISKVTHHATWHHNTKTVINSYRSISLSGGSTRLTLKSSALCELENWIESDFRWLTGIRNVYKADSFCQICYFFFLPLLVTLIFFFFSILFAYILIFETYNHFIDMVLMIWTSISYLWLELFDNHSWGLTAKNVCRIYCRYIDIRMFLHPYLYVSKVLVLYRSLLSVSLNHFL